MPKGVYIRTKDYLKNRKSVVGKNNPFFGKRHTPESSAKMRGQKNHLWKGDKVGYVSLHQWVVRWKGKPSLCEMCGTDKAKKYEWANIDHNYRRVLEDFIRMCISCHRKYDERKRDKKGRYM